MKLLKKHWKLLLLALAVYFLYRKVKGSPTIRVLDNFTRTAASYDALGNPLDSNGRVDYSLN
jgi:hypothetical protein